MRRRLLRGEAPGCHGESTSCLSSFLYLYTNRYFSHGFSSLSFVICSNSLILILLLLLALPSSRSWNLRGSYLALTRREARASSSTSQADSLQPSPHRQAVLNFPDLPFPQFPLLPKTFPGSKRSLSSPLLPFPLAQGFSAPAL